MTGRTFIVKRPFHSDSRREVVAEGPREAVQRWACCVDYESTDFDIAGGRDTPIVSVTDEDGKDYGFWQVEGVAVPEYRARKIREKPTEAERLGMDLWSGCKP
jgi:hypothetical protein